MPQLATLTVLSASSYPSPHPPDLRSFNALLDVLTKSGCAEKAQFLRKTLGVRFQAGTVSYNTVGEGRCRLKKTGKAVEVMKEMVESGLGPSLATCNILLKGFFWAGQVKQGQDFLVQMRKRGRRKDNSGNRQPDVVSYTTVVHGLGMDEQIEKARKVFDEIVGEGILPSVATYNALIQGSSSKTVKLSCDHCKIL